MARKKNHGKPYVRRIRGGEVATGLRDLLRLELLREMGGYVLVQRGSPNRVLAVGISKRQVKSMPLPVAAGRNSFDQWANRIKRRAQGVE